MVIHFYIDPGHGWAKVPRKLLAKLGIEREITPYSYQRGGFVYLAEDCDLGTLLSALRSQGVEPDLRRHHADKRSKIRGYASYIPLIND